MSSTILSSRPPLSAGSRASGEKLPEWTVAARRIIRNAFRALARRKSPPQTPLTPSEEAARVRAMATTYLKTDPGFAADLFAAADRFERTHGL